MFSSMAPVHYQESQPSARSDNIKRRRVLDLFGGSGSTLIACEKTGRRAHLMELDALYCDVIVRRWEVFTGTRANRRG
jgi:DNA modification methylase